jgi:hypothetical protein
MSDFELLHYKAVIIGLGAESEYQFVAKCRKWYYAVVAVISGDLLVITDIRGERQPRRAWIGFSRECRFWCR